MGGLGRRQTVGFNPRYQGYQSHDLLRAILARQKFSISAILGHFSAIFSGRRGQRG